MSESGLYAVEMASITWQESMNQNQQITANTVQQAATILMNLYNAAQKYLNWLMGDYEDPGDGFSQDDYHKYKSDKDKDGHYVYNPATQGKPNAGNSGDKDYSTEVNIWETFYNEKSQNFQNAENSINTPIQALDQHESSLGNSSQEASQIAGTVAQPNKIVANLLQSAL